MTESGSEQAKNESPIPIAHGEDKGVRRTSILAVAISACSVMVSVVSLTLTWQSQKQALALTRVGLSLQKQSLLLPVAQKIAAFAVDGYAKDAAEGNRVLSRDESDKRVQYIRQLLAIYYPVDHPLMKALFVYKDAVEYAYNHMEKNEDAFFGNDGSGRIQIARSEFQKLFRDYILEGQSTSD